jgi:hypothetical protein
LQDAVAILREEALDSVSPAAPEGRRYAEGLLLQAQAMLGESAKARYSRNLLREKRNAGALGELSTLLFSTLKEDQVLRVLKDQLDSVGIRHAEVVFFEAGENEADPAARGVIKRPGEEPAELRFSCKRFPPPGLYPEGEPFQKALVPLISGEDEMGFIAFDADNLAPCATIARAAAAAIRSARLLAKVHELSVTDPLTGLNNRRSLLDLLKKEVERSLRNKLSFAGSPLACAGEPDAPPTSSRATAAKNSCSSFRRSTSRAPGSSPKRYGL